MTANTRRLLSATVTFAAGCAGCESDNEPLLTYALVSSDADEDLPYGARGEGWALFGVVEVEPDLADVVITYDLNAHGVVEAFGSLGASDRAARVFYLDERTEPGHRLATLAAHEIGHVVLDTSEHATCGIMGNVDVMPCDEDAAIVDRAMKEMP